MHQPNITQALAEAGVADLQRATTHSTATVPPRRHRPHLRGLALLGLAATAALAPTIAIAQPTHDATPQIHTTAEPSQPVTSPYFDIEANKAAGMRELGLRIAQHGVNHTSPNEDIEANKARSQRAR